ncbi:ferredoxin [Mycolicibacterium flavescens]|uniref:Divergent 4Fe-4S mono-cluster domain-containing protein n=2 Tax=Mycolicibacterium flavescens TaxID=1776 RepID=A0A1E3RGP7_MYCFV|nr:ferredoxin [Mycolicibacterium flavescens]MCV7280354.1 ferredoxin [Mycolicibacterium flavescens]ODQ89038.1 hypothetical protein BHQ18_17455 [Mycolicibacterium flavescens]
MTRRKIVWVDQRLCEGHALCLQSAPEMFDLSDADQWDQAVAAVDACPRGAIALIEEPKGQPVR